MKDTASGDGYENKDSHDDEYRGEECLAKKNHGDADESEYRAKKECYVHMHPKSLAKARLSVPWSWAQG